VLRVVSRSVWPSSARSWIDYGNFLADELVAYASGETKSHGKQDHIVKANAFCAACPDNRVYTHRYLDLFSNEYGTKTCSIARIAGTLTGPLETSSGLIQPNHRAFDAMSCLSWKWRKRSSVKITERTHEKATEALHT
jgi:hypothetical protein